MFGRFSEFPRKIWNGLTGGNPRNMWNREVAIPVPPDGQDFEQACDEIIAVEEGCISLHEFITRVDDSLTATKDDLEQRIQSISLTPGESGKDGQDGRDGIDGQDGRDGIDGQDGRDGIDGVDGKTPTVEVLSEDEIKIGDTLVKLPRGKPGKNAPIPKRLAGMGGLSGGGGPGIQGPIGPAGRDGVGGGVTPQTAEVDSDVKIGMAIFIHYSGHAKLAKADARATVAVGLCNVDTLSGHAVEFLTDSAITQNDWSNVIENGSPSLTIGTYFLSNTMAGKITQVPPTTGIIQRIGRALSTICLDIEISDGVTL